MRIEGYHRRLVRSTAIGNLSVLCFLGCIPEIVPASAIGDELALTIHVRCGYHFAKAGPKVRLGEERESLACGQVLSKAQPGALSGIRHVKFGYRGSDALKSISAIGASWIGVLTANFDISNS
jgi:hypothetical protein